MRKVFFEKGRDMNRQVSRYGILLWIFLCSAGPSSIPQTLELHFVNVGHGDACLIRTPGNRFALIDTGLWIMGYKLKRYLRKMKVKELEYLIITHPHPDHYGGARTVIKYFRVKRFVDPGIPIHGGSYSRLLEAVKKKGIRHIVARKGKVLAIGKVSLEVLSPPEKLIKGVRSFENANSLVIMLRFKRFKALFTGDIEKETERILVESGMNLECQVFKVPHHGVSTSCTPEFLDKVKPKYAFIPCAYYAEPSRDLYDRFRKRGINWLRSDANGNVVFSAVQGKKCSITARFQRGGMNSRLKIAPDWFKLLHEARPFGKKVFKSKNPGIPVQFPDRDTGKAPPGSSPGRAFPVQPRT